MQWETDPHMIPSAGTKGQEWMEGRRKLLVKQVEEREIMNLYYQSVPLSSV